MYRKPECLKDTCNSFKSNYSVLHRKSLVFDLFHHISNCTERVHAYLNFNGIHNVNMLPSF